MVPWRRKKNLLEFALRSLMMSCYLSYIRLLVHSCHLERIRRGKWGHVLLPAFNAINRSHGSFRLSSWRTSWYWRTWADFTVIAAHAHSFQLRHLAFWATSSMSHDCGNTVFLWVLRMPAVFLQSFTMPSWAYDPRHQSKPSEVLHLCSCIQLETDLVKRKRVEVKAVLMPLISPALTWGRKKARQGRMYNAESALQPVGNNKRSVLPLHHTALYHQHSIYGCPFSCNRAAHGLSTHGEPWQLH